MVTPEVIPGSNGSAHFPFPANYDSTRGTYNFGTPTSPRTPEVPSRSGPELSPLSTDNTAFEIQVLERLSKLQRQQQTDAEVLLNVVDSRTAQLVNRLTILEKTVAHLLPEGPDAPLELTPLVEDVPVEAKPAVHTELQKFSLTTFVRIHLLKKLHFKSPLRGLKELRFDDLKWAVRDEFKKLSTEDQLSLVEDYVEVFVKKFKFESSSFRKKYPTVDFKGMGQFFSNASRGLRNLVTPGLV